MYQSSTLCKTGSLTVCLLLGLALAVRGQFSSGSSFVVKSGSVISIDGLNLKPAPDLILTDQHIEKSATPATTSVPGSLGSIAAVYRLNQPISYRGDMGIRYSDGELNGNTPELLALAYEDGVSGFSITSILTLSNDDHLVWGTTGINTIQLLKLTAVNTGIQLPVKLLFFEAGMLPGKVQLSWATGHEFNNDHFEVERSSDGTAFVLLNKLLSKGNSTATQNYHLDDYQPLKGLNYYRLKQVNQDRTATYSDIISVLFSEPGTDKIQLYPNPASRILNVALQWPSAQPSLITIFDASGRQVRQFRSPSTVSLSMRIDVSSLPVGIYYLKIKGTDHGYSKTFSVVK